MLTEKQERFCAAYLETGNATEAYRRAYGAEKMAPATVHRKAKVLIDNVKIRLRLAELRAPVVMAAQITLEQHLLDLKRLRDVAEKAADYGAAIRAEIARGKAAGLYVEKIDLNLTGTLAERLARARSRLDLYNHRTDLEHP